MCVGGGEEGFVFFFEFFGYLYVYGGLIGVWVGLIGGFDVLMGKVCDFFDEASLFVDYGCFYALMGDGDGGDVFLLCELEVLLSKGGGDVNDAGSFFCGDKVGCYCVKGFFLGLYVGH